MNYTNIKLPIMIRRFKNNDYALCACTKDSHIEFGSEKYLYINYGGYNNLKKEVKNTLHKTLPPLKAMDFEIENEDKYYSTFI